MTPENARPTAPERGPSPSARCGKHPASSAVDVCQRCGAFLCGDCVELLGEDVLCSDCFQRLGGARTPSLRARLSVALGILGLVTLFLPGLGGLWLARTELRLIAAARSPATGLKLARAGRILGWINFVLFCLVFLILAAFVAYGLWRAAADGSQAVPKP